MANPHNDPPADDMSDLERKLIAEAEAAVEAVRSGQGEDDGLLDFDGFDDASAGGSPAMDGEAFDEVAAARIEALEAELDLLRARVGELEAGSTELRDKWLRAVADTENMRKRAKRDQEDAVLRSAQSLLEAFFPVADNLERAMEVAGGADPQLLTGLKMVQNEFRTALAKHGISAVESVGKPFDPAVHEALQQVDSPDHPPGVIIREFERGYLRGDRLLRPARVVVAGPGSTGAERDPSAS
jgi:molecular chaperone GrpE